VADPSKDRAASAARLICTLNSPFRILSVTPRTYRRWFYARFPSLA